MREAADREGQLAALDADAALGQLSVGEADVARREILAETAAACAPGGARPGSPTPSRLDCSNY